MTTYDILKPFEQEIVSQSTLEKKISENRIVVLKGKKTSVLSGEGLSLKINASVGLNSLDGFSTEYKKIQAIKYHPNHPDIMMDLSTQQIPPHYIVL